MPSDNPNKTAMPGWIARILAMPNESTAKTLFVALAMCLICSVMVASATVFLRPIQDANKALDKKRNILAAAGLLQEGRSVEELFKQVETRIVDLKTGDYASADQADPATYDQRAALKNPALSEAVPAAEDIALIKRKPKYATVYLVKEEDNIKTIVLPVQGYGLWSTMYGFLALENDANTIAGLKFYEQAETPGLGGEVSNPQWQALWKGKRIYDDKGEPRIAVIKGTVDPSKPEAQYEVDGIGGSTLTSRGVMNLIRYWLGEAGFAPYLDRLRTQRG
jgi:Na+-transporting NADH:ubiquinone oxidoreductase subunit C